MNETLYTIFHKTASDRQFQSKAQNQIKIDNVSTCKRTDFQGCYIERTSKKVCNLQNIVHWMSYLKWSDVDFDETKKICLSNVKSLNL